MGKRKKEKKKEILGQRRIFFTQRIGLIKELHFQMKGRMESVGINFYKRKKQFERFVHVCVSGAQYVR